MPRLEANEIYCGRPWKQKDLRFCLKSGGTLILKIGKLTGSKTSLSLPLRPIRVFADVREVPARGCGDIPFDHDRLQGQWSRWAAVLRPFPGLHHYRCSR